MLKLSCLGFKTSCNGSICLQLCSHITGGLGSCQVVKAKRMSSKSLLCRLCWKVILITILMESLPRKQNILKPLCCEAYDCLIFMISPVFLEAN